MSQDEHSPGRHAWKDADSPGGDSTGTPDIPRTVMTSTPTSHAGQSAEESVLPRGSRPFLVGKPIPPDHPGRLTLGQPAEKSRSYDSSLLDSGADISNVAVSAGSTPTTWRKLWLSDESLLSDEGQPAGPADTTFMFSPLVQPPEGLDEGSGTSDGSGQDRLKDSAGESLSEAEPLGEDSSDQGTV
ncbi:uncharacterized protein LOC144165275 [Haemaphysalis longicornis]